MSFKIYLNIVNGGAGPLPQVHGGRVGICTWQDVELLAKLANQNVCLPVFDYIGYICPHPTQILLLVEVAFCGIDVMLSHPPLFPLREVCDITMAGPHSPMSVLCMLCSVTL